jgi:hypothetical protein
MASEPSYNCRIPSPNTPMVDPNTGMISQAWFRWATAMMTRTGDSEGIGSAGVQGSALVGQMAMLADLPEAPRMPALTMADVMADAPPARPTDGLMAVAMADDVPRPVNPFLAAMIMGDAT